MTDDDAGPPMTPEAEELHQLNRAYIDDTACYAIMDSVYWRGPDGAWCCEWTFSDSFVATSEADAVEYLRQVYVERCLPPLWAMEETRGRYEPDRLVPKGG